MLTPLKPIGLISLLLAACAGPSGDKGRGIVRTDHTVSLTSSAPAMAGRPVQLYVREVRLAGSARAPVVLFVHGAGTPAEVAFDVPHQDYSWMAYLAQAGFDVFSMDQTGYGRSTRPPAMTDPCNLPRDQQAQFIPKQLSAPCGPNFPTTLTTPASDWDDIGAVVEHLRKLRGVERVSLVGWSQGGPRAGGYAARNPDKVERLVALAPVYNADAPLEAPDPLPPSPGPMSAQSEAAFQANWDRQVGCADQYDPATRASVWMEMLASDAVGSGWEPAVRRAPQVPVWGWNRAVVSKLQTPFLMVSGVHDKQIVPDVVRNLYRDAGSPQKVFVDLACSSHNAMWERNHLLLFKASLDWLKSGQVNGVSQGEVRLGY
jgi:pimeloyl-ACP methyl ester carboxylesterase